jgi:N-acyl-D-amino-acid deacylase
MTLGYALWTMSIGEAKWTQLSGSLVNKALATQQADGRWRIHSVRPPAASSELMATTLVLFGLQHYENNAIQKGDEDIAQARLRASLWRARQPQALNTEDRCAEIWFDYLAKSSFLSMLNVQKDKVGGAGGQPSLYSVASDRIDGKLTPEELQELGDFYTKSRFDQQRKNLIESQNSDGGWGIGLNHESDAYSTATALLILTQSEDYEKFEFVFDKLWFRYGIRYLLNTQKPDGSWHVSSRANPVQEFFDNGDPHDTDQFISIQATAWAVAALACDQHRINDPLGLPLSPVNTGRGYYDRKTATP